MQLEVIHIRPKVVYPAQTKEISALSQSTFLEDSSWVCSLTLVECVPGWVRGSSNTKWF